MYLYIRGITIVLHVIDMTQSTRDHIAVIMAYTSFVATAHDRVV